MCLSQIEFIRVSELCLLVWVRGCFLGNQRELTIIRLMGSSFV